MCSYLVSLVFLIWHFITLKCKYLHLRCVWGGDIFHSLSFFYLFIFLNYRNREIVSDFSFDLDLCLFVNGSFSQINCFPSLSSSISPKYKSKIKKKEKKKNAANTFSTLDRKVHREKQSIIFCLFFNLLNNKGVYGWKKKNSKFS